MFQKATKKAAKLRLALDGPAGSGKTYNALLVAQTLGGKVALLDTEHGSASKYADKFSFDAAELDLFSIDNYLKAISAAASAGYDVLIIDSLSHAWSGRGGALEEVDRAGGSNKFTNGWGTVTPKHNRLIDAIVAFPGHVIATMRTKSEYVIEDKNGKKVPRRIGTAPVQRDGMEYEFDVVVELDRDGQVTITKTRCSDLAGSAGMLTYADVPQMAKTLRAWLSDGAEVSPMAIAAAALREKAATEQAAREIASMPDPEFKTQTEKVKALLREKTGMSQEKTVQTPWGRLLEAAKAASIAVDRLKAITKDATGKGKPAELTDADEKMVLERIQAIAMPEPGSEG